jgi:hypothetical protein
MTRTRFAAAPKLAADALLAVRHGGRAAPRAPAGAS